MIEGFREITRAFQGGVKFHSLYLCPKLFLGKNEEALIGSIACEKWELPDFLFEKISYRDRPDGLIAIAHQRALSLVDLKFKNKPPFLVIAEAIEKPGNLGTILRSADAAGVDGVIVCDRCTDIHNPNVVRASVGTLFTIPVIEAKGQEVLAWLKEKKIQIVAATPSGKKLYTESDFTQAVAIVVGTEQLGLSSLWIESADICVRIPMRGVADSLNVATATTLLLYEVIRQRAL